MQQQQAYVARVRVRLALALHTAVALDGHRNCFRALGWLAEDIEAVVFHGWLTVQFVLEDLECLPPNGMLNYVVLGTR